MSVSFYLKLIRTSWNMCKLFILVPSYIAKFPKPIECPYLVLPPSPVGLAGGRGRSAWLEDVAGGRGQWAWLEDVALECGRRAWLEGEAGGRGRRVWQEGVAGERGTWAWLVGVSWGSGRLEVYRKFQLTTLAGRASKFSLHFRETYIICKICSTIYCIW